jgi:hypothetical protein
LAGRRIYMGYKYVHITDKFRVGERFYAENRDAVMFIERELRYWDMSMARWFRLVDINSKPKDKQPRIHKSTWGNNRYKRNKVTGELILPLSINCRLFGTDDDFPNKDSTMLRPDGRLVPHRVLDNVSDLLVHVASHELWHYLCGTGQINSNNTELYADNFADVMVYKFSGKDIRR